MPSVPAGERAIKHTDQQGPLETSLAAQLLRLARSSADVADFSARLQEPAAQIDALAANKSGAGSRDGASSAPEAAPALPEHNTEGGVREGAGAGGVEGSNSTRGVQGGGVRQLTRTLAHRHAKGGILMVTFSNYHHLDFALNWVQHVQVGQTGKRQCTALVSGTRQGCGVHAQAALNCAANDCRITECNAHEAIEHARCGSTEPASGSRRLS